MHRIRAGTDRNLKNFLHDQVRGARCSTVKGVRLIGKFHMLGVTIRLGVDGDGLYALVAGGTDHSHRDLPAVGNQDFADRARVAIRYRRKFLLIVCRISGHGGELLLIYPAESIARNGWDSEYIVRLDAKNVRKSWSERNTGTGAYPAGSAQRVLSGTPSRESMSLSAFTDRPITACGSP